MAGARRAQLPARPTGPDRHWASCWLGPFQRTDIFLFYLRPGAPLLARERRAQALCCALLFFYFFNCKRQKFAVAAFQLVASKDGPAHNSSRRKRGWGKQGDAKHRERIIGDFSGPIAAPLDWIACKPRGHRELLLGGSLLKAQPTHVRTKDASTQCRQRRDAPTLPSFAPSASTRTRRLCTASCLTSAPPHPPPRVRPLPVALCCCCYLRNHRRYRVHIFILPPQQGTRGRDRRKRELINNAVEKTCKQNTKDGGLNNKIKKVSPPSALFVPSTCST